MVYWSWHFDNLPLLIQSESCWLVGIDFLDFALLTGLGVAGDEGGGEGAIFEFLDAGCGGLVLRRVVLHKLKHAFVRIQHWFAPVERWVLGNRSVTQPIFRLLRPFPIFFLPLDVVAVPRKDIVGIFTLSLGNWLLKIIVFFLRLEAREHFWVGCEASVEQRVKGVLAGLAKYLDSDQLLEGKTLEVLHVTGMHAH